MMKRFLTTAAPIGILGGTFIALWWLQPTFASKANGYFLSGLAIIFTLQDSMFWSARKRAGELLSSHGVKPDDLDDAFYRVMAFQKYLTSAWGLAVALRCLSLAAGIWMCFDDQFQISRQLLGWVGYGSGAIGAVVALCTYMAYAHVDTVLLESEVEGRKRKAGEAAAKEIRDKNSDDWKKDPSLSGYGNAVKVKTRRRSV